MSDSTHLLPARWGTILIAVGSLFCLLGIMFGIVIGVAFSYLSVTPEPTVLPIAQPAPMDLMFIVIAAQNFQEGDIIPPDGIVISNIPTDLIVETWIAGPELEDLASQVVGCKARLDIPRAMLMTTNLVDCP
ncbi:MAG: hypothetical protein KAJ55_08220 [Anaerolineales bacterium]|nr:hypothetical protein [Anaerolineales bacterium]